MPVFSRRQKLILGVLLVLSVTATGLVLFGPGRGAREDLAHLRTDLHGTRAGVATTASVSRRTLDELSAELQTTQKSLEIQVQGLSVARSSQRIAGSTARSTETIRRQTVAALATTRHVLAALGPLRKLRGDVTMVTAGVQAGVALARTTLEVGRQTLEQVTRINRKIPAPAVFGTGDTGLTVP